MKINFFHIVGAWLTFAVLIAAIMYIVHPPNFRGFSFFVELQWEMAFAIVWITATPFVLSISKRYTLKGKQKLQYGFILFCIGIVLAIVLCFGHAVIAYLLSSKTGGMNASNFYNSFYYNIDKMIIVYCVLVVLQQALTYYEDIQEKEIKASQLETQLAQAQMQALKMQLQPHFLFNTLNAIVTLVHKNPDQAEEMIVRLSNFLRLTLMSSGKQIVALKEELSFVKAYLEIEEVRFEGKLQYIEHVPAEFYDAHVPMLLLQPLIENAIKHGISKYAAATVLEVHAHSKDDFLIIIVKNNGESLDSARESIQEKGIGLANTRARLEALYGNNASLEAVPNSPNGFIVTVTLPLTNNHSDEN